MAITLGLVEAVDSNGVYVSMPGSRGVVRGPYRTINDVAVGAAALIVSTDDGEQVVVGVADTPPRHGIFNVLDYGAAGDGTTDDTAALTAAVAAASAAQGTLYVPEGVTLKLTAQVDMTGDYGIDCRGGLLIAQTSTPGILIGHHSDSWLSHRIFLRQVIHSPYSTTVPAVRIQGVIVGDITVLDCDYLQLFADGDDSAADFIAYSSFTLGDVRLLHLYGENGIAVINENTFHGGRIEEIRIEGPYPHNNNVFMHPKIEGDWSEINVLSGHSNMFQNVRAEGGSSVTFADGTMNNIVTQSWLADNRIALKPSFTVSDDGQNNSVTSVHSALGSWVPLVELAPGLCVNVKSLQGAEEALGAAVGYGTFTDSGSAVSSSGGWTVMVDTGLIPVRRAGQEWNEDLVLVTALQATSDEEWFRWAIVGYDAAGDRIDTEWDAGGGATWDTTYLLHRWMSDRISDIFTIEDPSVCWVRVLVTTIGSVVPFTRFSLEAFVKDPSVLGDFEIVRRRVISRPVVTGSRGSNAALTSLITQLASLGLITDSSS